MLFLQQHSDISRSFPTFALNVQHSTTSYYNRDTYYALGGDDYDALKRRGGNADDAIDNLMDYLGY